VATANGLYNTTILSTMGIIPNKLHKSLKLLNLRPGLYILMQKAVILNIYHIVRKFLAVQWIRSSCSVRPILFWEPAKLPWIKEYGWNNNNNNNNYL
jgi:hypothetical protein